MKFSFDRTFMNYNHFPKFFHRGKILSYGTKINKVILFFYHVNWSSAHHFKAEIYNAQSTH